MRANDLLLTEGKRTLSQVNLLYKKTDLAPVLSKETIDYHYGKLYKTYVDRFNNGEGDLKFNEAGAVLHGIYFSQFQPIKPGNKPSGPILDFIIEKFDTLDKLKEAFEKEAMSIQGSGWVYLSKSGEIKTIKNHAMRSDILLLVDWWEHAWYDYKWDKKGYLTNLWKIIDWDIINARLS